MEALIKIAEEKLIRLQHYPPDKRYSVFGQLISYLIFHQDSAGNGTEIEQLAISLSRMSEEQVCNYLFPADDEGYTIEYITRLLSDVTTEAELYEVMIETLLDDAMREWSDPEPQ